MITKEGMKVLSFDDKYITYQMNNPIYNNENHFTWTYNDENPHIVTLVIHPLFNNTKNVL